MIRDFARVNAPRIAARVLRSNTIRRTKSGMSVNGSVFKQYSKAYSSWRLRNSLPVSPVDLFALASDEQHMFLSLDYYDNLTTTAGTGHSLAVSAETNPRATGNQRSRPWLGVDSIDGPMITIELNAGFNRLHLHEAMPYEAIIT